ncbi:MAG: cation:proton antiporter [Galbitalea sp.]
MKSVPLDYVLVPLIAVVATLLANLIGRVARIPLVVFEIVLGLVVGPAVLGWVQPGVFTNTLSNLGLAMLFFMAGNEIDFAAIRGRSLRRAGIGWLISIVAGTALGIGLAPSPTTGVFVGIALASTALGTILPILRDEGELATPFGRAVTAVGAVGEFGPLLAISPLSKRTPTGRGGHRADHLRDRRARGSLVRLAREQLWAAPLVTATLHSSGQFAIRLVILILGALVTLSLALGLDMLLGAFAAGVISRLLLADAPRRIARPWRASSRPSPSASSFPSSSSSRA